MTVRHERDMLIECYQFPLENFEAVVIACIYDDRRCIENFISSDTALVIYILVIIP